MRKTRCLCLLVVVGLLWGLSRVQALDNGLGHPAMGYNTWNDFRCNINAKDIMDAADAIIKQGLNKLGYVYVNMDDCWAAGRNPTTGMIYPDPVAFPKGIKAVADYVHSLGLKFGIYTDRGNMTCEKRPGSFGYETIDAKTYAMWGVDYLKEDSCFAPTDPPTAFAQYALMRDALNATGRHIYFSLCGWQSWYAPVGAALGNSWRIAGDASSWRTVLRAIDTSVNLGAYAQPGAWNDPDMLIGSDPATAYYLTQDQSRTMFSMWSVLAAPLLIGSNIRNLNAFDLETYSNVEVIAVDQDPMGLQGIRLSGSSLQAGSPQNIWGRLLSDENGGGWAVVFLNNANVTADVTCDADCFSLMGFDSSSSLYVRDLWRHTNNGTIAVAKGFTAFGVPPLGGSVMARFTSRPL
ncbi:Alpha-galactosidase [Balamuthia mandrillaris]